MDKRIFSKEELNEIEALEVKGGTGDPREFLYAQGECVNTADGCGGDVDQAKCVNKATGCGRVTLKDGSEP